MRARAGVPGPGAPVRGLGRFMDSMLALLSARKNAGLAGSATAALRSLVGPSTRLAGHVGRAADLVRHPFGGRVRSVRSPAVTATQAFAALGYRVRA